MPTVEIMLGDGARHFTHTVKNPRLFTAHFAAAGGDSSSSGDGEGLDIRDTEDRVTVLRFEN